ncbi:unnamed protein product [Adineta ricciae]|uniref:ADP ribosyltransferase domain-containing protein n=1 Tax=Adineta ricciae TaxID=249248 RepID=A0A815XTL6_ADIRI|nr:unnamed protein product [Adineta ricciae]
MEEDIVLIWLKSTTDTPNNIDEIQDELQTVHNSIRIHNVIDECINDIKSRKEKIFLIIAENQVSACLSEVNKLSQLDSVFVFPGIPQEDGHSYSDFHKIRCIFDKLEALIKSIKENIKMLHRQMEVVSFYGQYQQGTRDLEDQSSEFLWFRLFKDVIHHLPDDKQAKPEMLDICRKFYRNNQRMLRAVDQFETEYCKEKIALCTEDIEQLYKFRYYISDLSKQLAEKYQQMKNEDEKQFTLYRGVSTTKKEFERLKANIKNSFAVNSYWSTSRDRSCALTFAKRSIHQTDMVAVLYEIQFNKDDQQNSAIFADITDSSCFNEQEILFDAGSSFRIESIDEIEEDHTKLCIIKITTICEENPLGQNHMEHNRAQMKEEGPRIMLCILLKRMGKFEKSLRFLRNLLENRNDDENPAHIHNRYGIALKDKKEYTQALIHLEEAFQKTFNSNSSADRIYSAYVRHNQGLVYTKQRKYEEALKLYHEAIDILKKHDDTQSRSGLAQFNSSIGRVYLYRKDFKKALEYQEEALQIRKALKPDHVMNAFFYANTANVYSAQKKFKEALDYHLEALKLREKYLLPNSHHIAWNLYQVARMFYKLKDSSEARDYYQNSLEIFRNYANTDLWFHIPRILEDVALISED